MNFAQLSAYLQAYLETNDTAVIGQIPNFMALAAARISTDLRSSLIEQTSPLLAQQVQPLPDGFIAATLLKHNAAISGYVTPTAFNELSGTSFNCYTLLSGQISINPAPASGDVIELSYYVAGDESLSGRLPHLLLHGAAMEAELYQGNTSDAQIEAQLYQQDLQQANGWDINSGPISLGGAARNLAAEPLALNTTPTRAVDVSYSPAPGVFSTNVQAAITEVQGNLGSHTGNLSNPHQTTAEQVGAIPFVAPGLAGNILSSDGTEWQSVDPSVAISGVSTFNGRTGAVNPIIGDYQTWFAQTPTTVADNSVALFDGVNGRTQKAGPLISELATVASLGTAAFANKQASTTDTTAGALMAVGAFGLGNAVGTEIATDLNALPPTGMYTYTSAAANIPVAATGGCVWCISRTAGSGSGAQIASATSAASLYFRQQSLGTWGAWQKVVTGVKQTSATDTTAGALMAVGAFGLGSLPTPTITTSITDASLRTGLYTVANTATGAPVADFWTLIHQGSIPNYVVQQITRINTPYDTYIRVCSNSVWQPWQQVQTSATSLGVDQAWQTVSRTFGVTYTNSTGRPIEVCCVATGGFFNLSSMGIVVGLSPNAINTSALTSFGPVTIPNGAQYVWVNQGSSTTPTFTELR